MAGCPSLALRPQVVSQVPQHFKSNLPPRRSRLVTASFRRLRPASAGSFAPESGTSVSVGQRVDRHQTRKHAVREAVTNPASSESRANCFALLTDNPHFCPPRAAITSYYSGVGGTACSRLNVVLRGLVVFVIHTKCDFVAEDEDQRGTSTKASNGWMGVLW